MRPHKTTHKNTFLKEVRSRRPPVILTPTYEPTENFLKRHYATAFSLMVISRSDTTSCVLTHFYLLTALSVYMASGTNNLGTQIQTFYIQIYIIQYYICKHFTSIHTIILNIL